MSLEEVLTVIAVPLIYLTPIFGFPLIFFLVAHGEQKARDALWEKYDREREERSKAARWID